jgi:hypothetical protein
MTKRDNMVVFVSDNHNDIPGVSTFLDLMMTKKVEKIPIVTSKNEITGLVTLKDA